MFPLCRAYHLRRSNQIGESWLYLFPAPRFETTVRIDPDLPGRQYLEHFVEDLFTFLA